MDLNLLFGLHELIEKESKYISLIRNPIERAISSTNFNYQRGFVSGEKINDYLIESEIDNPQTRILAGRSFTSGECNEEVLEIAKKNIEKHFLLVGLTEDTNTFIQALIAIQNWGTFALVKSQVTGKKIISELPSELIEKLHNKHGYDMQLYEWVKTRWNDWKKDHIDTSMSHIDNEKVICITSDFANTKKPSLLSIEEIKKYNDEISENENDLVEISQNHDKAVSKPALDAQESEKASTSTFTPYRQMKNEEYSSVIVQESSYAPPQVPSSPKSRIV